MIAELACFDERCRARYPITDVIYNCPRCGALLEAVYAKPSQSAAELKNAVAHAADVERPARPERRVALPRVLPFLSGYQGVVTAARRKYPAARSAAGRPLWRAL